MLTLAYDRLVVPNIGYPNLARHPAEPYTQQWRQFDLAWPFSVPLRLLMYTKLTKSTVDVVTVDQEVKGAWYPVCFGWFDFGIDYISLISHNAMDKIRKGDLKILFYYHEGDNPERILKRLNTLCANHRLPSDCFVFVSANTACQELERCIYFQDHECFFYYVNREQTGNTTTLQKRDYEFTALSRTHKWWRASVMCDMAASGVLSRSLWSYNTSCQTTESFNDNPIEIDSTPNLRNNLAAFMEKGPYRCDDFDSRTQNDHHWVNQDLYERSYFHIILETHFDADQSGGTFLTEKTFKAIKYGQPFVIAGPPGSLQQLKKSGYRTFDHVIDNSYDTEINNTRRWIMLHETLKELQQGNMFDKFVACLPDIQHNQDLFSRRLETQVNNLLHQLSCYQ